MSRNFEPRPVVYLPNSFNLKTPGLFELTLRDRRIIPGVCVDGKGMIYGVLIPLTADRKRNPIHFQAQDIVAAKPLHKVPDSDVIA